MTPYPIHEEPVMIFDAPFHSVIAQIGHDPMAITVKVNLNSTIISSSDETVPDLQTTIERYDAEAEPGDIPIWVGESGFSSYEKAMKERLCTIASDNPSVELVFMVSIKEKGRSHPTIEVNEEAQALRAGPQLSPIAFRAPHGSEPSFGPVIVGGMNWISIREIRYTVYMRGTDGTFNFDTPDANFAQGTMYPDVKMDAIDAILQRGVEKFKSSIIDAMRAAHGRDEFIQGALQSTPTLNMDWKAAQLRLSAAVYRSAYCRYRKWLRLQAVKRKGAPSSPPLAGPSQRGSSLSPSPPGHKKQKVKASGSTQPKRNQSKGTGTGSRASKA
ncbi:hypothetical protein BJ138DRAFT_1186755 [Hygrophoropsis aurantiaca]|uniref:Uncharacterized protein n=1 Tax=Hygrophoropsis aurantiaca TaxID=72124 RepID=A0ACB7ZT83_9AGAM|nr:hypothetical protein BJ138DRAFT_1186755 [Hygrophoropsis aurantiaca]